MRNSTGKKGYKWTDGKLLEKEREKKKENWGRYMRYVGCFRVFTVLKFNTTLTGKVILWWSVTHMCFLALTPGLTELFFSKPLNTFFTCFCKNGRPKYAGMKVCLNQGLNSQPPGQESNTLTTEPPGRDNMQYGLVKN